MYNINKNWLSIGHPDCRDMRTTEVLQTFNLNAEPGYKDYKYFRFKLLTTRSVYGILIVNRPGGQ